MTDQTPFERELTDRLRARAEVTRVDLDHDRIVGTSARRVRPPAARPTWVVAGAFAGVIALVVVGLSLLVRTTDDPPAPTDTVPARTAAPATTVPAAPDYGVLDDTAGPTVNDHWHVAYSFNLCGQWVQLAGTLEEVDAQGNLVNDAFLDTGVHSHDDGVIHVHPYSDAATGNNATLGLFLANYDVELTDDGIRAPSDVLDDTRCGTGGKELVVVVWPDATDPTQKLIISDGLAGTPLRDGAAITIAVTDAPDDVPPPPWAAQLPDLAAVDTAQLAPEHLLQSGAPPVP